MFDNNFDQIKTISNEPGKLITFGKHKGNTIEQIFFKDYSWLNWAISQDNMPWIEWYMKKMPKIFPRKIKILCGANHSYGCKLNTATIITVPIDSRGHPIVELGAAYFWCKECLENSLDLKRNPFFSLSLDFSTHVMLLKRNDMDGFSAILRKAYGIARPCKQAAYDIFWK